MSDKRLNKAISETGYCSRREADKYIEQGLVTVNDKVAGLGVRVNSADEIRVKGQLIKKEVEAIYLAFNKPAGITCTTEQHVAGNIIDYINFPERIFPIGRLDKPSEGLILLTNDGDIVNKILRANNRKEKEYIVKVNKPLTNEFIKKMSQGVPILNTITRPCVVKKINQKTFRIILTEGLNRQIRRMCSHFDYRVESLKRVRIMHIHLGDLPKGEHRLLTAFEKSELFSELAQASKTAD